MANQRTTYKVLKTINGNGHTTAVGRGIATEAEAEEFAQILRDAEGEDVFGVDASMVTYTVKPERRRR